MSDEQSKPPRLAARIMVALLRRQRSRRVRSLEEHHQIADAVAGDMEEVYLGLTDSQGVSYAKRWYWREVRRTLFPSLNYRLGLSISMLISNLKIAFRHLWRTRWYTALNVGGLGVALAVAVIAFIYGRNELSYDQFHPDHESIYRAGTSIVFDGPEVWGSTPYPLGSAMLEQIPSVEAVSRLMRLRGKGISVEENRIEADVHMVSSGFLSMFSFPMHFGVSEMQPGEVILSSEAAGHLFGGQAAMCQNLQIEMKSGEWRSFEVVGIAQPLPANSSITFDYLIADSQYEEIFGPGAATDWGPKSGSVTFAKLRPGADLEAIGESMNAIARANNLDEFTQGHDFEQLLPLESLADWHFSSAITNRVLRPNGDKQNLLVVGALALLLLTIACVNFVNLSLGLSAKRAREVGVRKVFGAERAQLIRQYSSEALLVAGAALAVGIGIAFALLPTFNTMMGQNLSVDLLADPKAILALAAIALVVGLLAGAYPSFYLSQFRPIQVLQSKLNLGGRNLVRRAMVGFQFAASIFLIAAGFTASKQLQHLSRKDLGYNQEFVVMQQVNRGIYQETIDLYRERLAQNPNISGVSGARATMMGDGPDSALLVELDGQEFAMAANKIDDRFLDVLELELVAGRNLSTERPTDMTGAVLVNETFAEAYGVGPGDETPFDITREGAPTIVGVVSDYHFMSLRKEIEPTILYFRPESRYRQIFTRVGGADLTATIEMMRATWEEIQAESVFSYTFLDEAIQNQYLSENRNRRAGMLGAMISLAIAIAGLLGITSLSVARRTHEIGVRKVLGASSRGIILLFNAEYATVILVSSLAAIPLSYLAMEKWLGQFAYRVSVDPLVLIGAVLLVMTVAAVTISLECFRSAVRNPVDAIRYE